MWQHTPHVLFKHVNPQTRKFVIVEGYFISNVYTIQS